MQEIQGFRLSPHQARLWRQQQNGPSSWNAQAVIEVAGDLDRAALRLALQAVVDRHEILRTTFHRTPGVAIPIQLAAAGEVSLRAIDLAAEAPAAREARVREILEQETRAPRDLGSDLPLRPLLVGVAPQRHLLVLTLPALCADARSLCNLFREIAGDYAGHAGGADRADRADRDPEEVVQYVQFSEWQHELVAGENGEGAEFWRRQALGSPASLPFVQPLAMEGESTPAFLEAHLEGELVDRLDALAAELLVAPDLVPFAAWLGFLGRVTGQRELVVGRAVSGRSFAELEGALGLFSRQFPVRIGFEPETAFREIVIRTARAAGEAESFQDYFPPASGDGTEDAFAFELIDLPGTQEAGGLTFSLSDLSVPCELPQAGLLCLRRGRSLVLRLLYDREQLGEAYARCLLGQFQALLGGISLRPDSHLGEVDLLDAAERERLVERFNATRSDFPDEPLHALLAAQVERAPERLAVEIAGRRLTFGELDAAANRLAHYLRRQGVGREDRIAICLTASPEMVVALLGVLKAGAAYLPLDARHPRERLESILLDAAPRVVLTEERLAALVGLRQRTILLDVEREAIERESDRAPQEWASGENLAYILYTSGSTGSPKGVSVTHRGLVNYLTWCTSAYAMADGLGAPVHSPIGFDLTVTSLWGPLLSGRTVTLVPEEQGIEGLAATLRGAVDFSLVKITPSHLSALAHWLAPQAAAGRTGVMVIGGEALLAEQLAFWRAHAPGMRIINEYGPTEAVVGCCTYEVTPELPAKGKVPIGRPIANAAIYVLDGGLRPVAVGLPGEIFIGGVGLARGYLAQPVMTAERFVPDPFGTTAGGRLYRSGDVARFRPDGELEYLGRNDDQVKVRGHRMELGEIEACLQRHAGVRESVAILREDVAGDPRLVAYFTSDLPGDALREELRGFLRSALPEPMVPSALVRLEALPLTANGKVNRAALPPPEKIRLAGYVAPRTDFERAIAEIWQEVLQVERVGLNDNFFDLGGHSLLMVQVYSRLRRDFDTEATMVELFEFPTVSTMAAFIAGDRQGGTLDATQERAEARRAALTRDPRRERRNVVLEPDAGEPR